MEQTDPISVRPQLPRHAARHLAAARLKVAPAWAWKRHPGACCLAIAAGMLYVLYLMLRSGA